MVCLCRCCRKFLRNHDSKNCLSKYWILNTADVLRLNVILKYRHTRNFLSFVWLSRFSCALILAFFFMSPPSIWCTGSIFCRRRLLKTFFPSIYQNPINMWHLHCSDITFNTRDLMRMPMLSAFFSPHAFFFRPSRHSIRSLTHTREKYRKSFVI